MAIVTTRSVSCFSWYDNTKSEQKADELKKYIYQRFEAQSEMIKSAVHDAYGLLY